MEVVKKLGESLRDSDINCGPGEWVKVRVYKEDGETVIRKILR